MQNLAKRQWGHSLSLKQSSDIMIDWCVRAREKNILRKKPPQIYFAYVLEDTPPMQYMHNISAAFKYSQKDVPYIDQSRDTLLRCLAVALKAHFFLFADDAVAYEPYFFTIPSLNEPTQTIFGLVYKIEKENKSIVVCEKELSLLFDKSKVVFEFPVVVIEDSFKWYHMKNWYKIKQQASLENVMEKPWLNKKNATSARDAKTQEELEKYATILEVPFDIKDEIKPLGIEWNKTLKQWFLPKGFDVESVTEYINYQKKELAKLPPKDNKDNKDNKSKESKFKDTK